MGVPIIHIAPQSSPVLAVHDLVLFVLSLVTVEDVLLVGSHLLLTHHVAGVVLLVIRCAHSGRSKRVSIAHCFHCVCQLVDVHFVLDGGVVGLLVDTLHGIPILTVAGVLKQDSHFITQVGDSGEETILGILLGSVAIGSRYVEGLLVLLQHHLLIHLCLG
jgi:hypothetical protein